MTTNYILTTMSGLVSFLMLLVMLVIVNTMPGRPTFKKKLHGMVRKLIRWYSECVKKKRKTLDVPMAHKTKRGELRV